MKNITTILFIAAMILAAGCTKEPSSQSPETGYRLVTFNCANDSKVTLNPGTKQISWHWTEYMGVYSFTAAEESAKVGKKFTSTNSSSEFSGQIVEDATKVYAVYPFYGIGTSEAVSAATETFFNCSPEGEITTTLGQTQYLVKNDVSSCSNLAACIAEFDGDGKLTGTLKNVCAYLKFTLENASTLPIRQILVESVNDAPLSGLATISFDEDGIPVVTGLESTYVVGVADNNASAFEDGTYYMTFFPANLSTGLHITMSGTDGNIYEFTTQGFTAERNQVYNLGTIDAERTATPGKMTVLLNAGTTTMVTKKSDASSYVNFTDNGYTFYNYNVWKQYGGIVFNSVSGGEKGFIEGPAIEGKILKKINVTFMSGTNLNNRTTIRVCNSTESTTMGSTRYTGNYQATGNTVADNQAVRFPLSDNTKAYFFHQFVLGTKGDREGGSVSSGATPSANTRYQLTAMASASYSCLVRFIEFVYEDAAE